MSTRAKFAATLAAATIGLIVVVLLMVPAFRVLFTAGGSTGGETDVLTLSQLPETSNVYDDQGNLIATFHADQNRVPVTYSQVPKGVVEAVVDTEDANFWIDHGFDIWSTLRALFSNASAGGVVQGGSTITQQLVKNTILTDQRTVSRKLKEAVVAVRLENELTKQQIMERYLNTVYFGNGAYGIAAAAQTYYQELVGQLTRTQAAFLAGLISDPTGYDPLQNPAASLARRNYVLGRMVAHGDLTKGEMQGSEQAPIPTAVSNGSAAPPLDPQDAYFVEEVKQRLLNDPDLGATEQDRYNAVFTGGLQIYTTLDPADESDAEQAVADILPSDGGRWTSALVSVDSKSGAVRALVGGPGYNLSQYRIATEGPGRQPGSSFKPIVLATALKEGYTINAGIDGQTPCLFTGYGAPYTAHNDEGGASGYMNLAYALAQSVNCAYLRLGIDVGLPNVVSMAKALGITTPLQPYLSMSIGSETVRPIDMAGAYATFADDGVHHTPYLVDRVLDRNGKVLLTGGGAGTQVLSADKAHEELVALRDVVTEGTGTAAQLPDRPAYGKTGTTDSSGDAWFDGITPQLTTVVWMGSPVAETPMYGVGGYTATGAYEYPREVFGGTYPAMIWQDYMAKALAGQPVLAFPPPNSADMGDLYSVPDPSGSSSPAAITTTTAPGATTTSIGPGGPLPPAVSGPPGKTSPGGGGGGPPTVPPSGTPTTEGPVPTAPPRTLKPDGSG